MNALIIYRPTKILAKVYGEKPLTLSSRTSSKSLNGSCLRLVSSTLLCRKACRYLRSSNSEAAKTKVPQEDESKVASLRFELRKECQYGEQFLVVGDDPNLGSWNPLNAAPLNWSDGHKWTIDLELPVGETIHYKFICKLSTGDIVWQPGPDRTICLTERQKLVIVAEDWENAATEKIIKEENPFVDSPETETSDPFGRSCTTKMKEGLLELKSKEKSEEENLVIYDEGCVLVPGLTLQVITEEGLAKELQNTILASSCYGSEGDRLVEYDEGRNLISEAPGKKTKKVVLNSITGDNKSVKNKEEDVPL